MHDRRRPATLLPAAAVRLHLSCGRDGWRRGDGGDATVVGVNNGDGAPCPLGHGLVQLRLRRGLLVGGRLEVSGGRGEQEGRRGLELMLQRRGFGGAAAQGCTVGAGGVDGLQLCSV
jgi:hypothetical protein